MRRMGPGKALGQELEKRKLWRLLKSWLELARRLRTKGLHLVWMMRDFGRGPGPAPARTIPASRQLKKWPGGMRKALGMVAALLPVKKMLLSARPMSWPK